MMKSACALVALFLVGCSATPELAMDRQALEDELMGLLNDAAFFDRSLSTRAEIARKNTLETKSSWEKGSSLPIAFRPYWDRAWDNYIRNSSPPITGAQLARKYMDAYAKSLSDDDLKGLIAHHSSPLGRRSKLAYQRAAPVIDEEYAALAARADQAATSQFFRDLTLFAKECNCGAPDDPSAWMQRRPESSRH
jgi:hypothetical protein